MTKISVLIKNSEIKEELTKKTLQQLHEEK